MRLLVLCLFTALVGCATTKTITIDSKPPGATIEIDNGVVRGKAPLTHQFVWENETDVHNVTAILPGYRELPVPIRRDETRQTVTIDLKPLSKKISIIVKPVPATISIDDKPVSNELLAGYNTPTEYTFEQDGKGNWRTHMLKAERPGFQPAEFAASWPDNKSTYILELKPLSKELNVNTIPTGASIYFDDELIGTSPIEKAPREFAYDVTTEKFYPHKLKATLPGYPEKSIDISWDEGKSDYTIALVPATKNIKIKTVPPGGIVVLEGKQLRQDSAGDSIVSNLTFPPINGKGDLKTYTGTITKKAEDREWYPFTIPPIGWDNDQREYKFELKEIRTKPMQLLTMSVSREGNAWQVRPAVVDTIAGRYIGERPGQTPVRLTPAEVKGQSIDSLAISPDGKQMLFTTLAEKPDFHSLMYVMASDGSTTPALINDGKSLDVTPNFSPDGESILYSSDRAGNRLIICSRPASGALGTQQYTLGDTTDLWPCMDSSPKPRIFYEARSDRLGKPSIFARPTDMTSRMDLGVDGGMQPRINAKNDAIVYTQYNERTGKRDIFTMRVGERGTAPMNLTNSPDADDYDPSWDRDGARIVFASDAGVDPFDKRRNADLYVLDLSQGSSTPLRLTENPSQDDRPIWDPNGKAIYFRSNRGVEWGIWKINLVK